MHIRPVTFDRLTADEYAVWCAIQRDEPHLISPFFRPEFTQAVATVRNNVEVCVMEQAGRPVGFLPYCRTSWNSGTPVGARLSDYHGVIARRDVEYDPIRLVRACRLSSLRFDHLIAGHNPLARFVWRQADSPYVDLSEGFDAYQATRSGHMRSDLCRKRKSLERKVGVVRFDPNVRDASILSTLIEWKTRQFERTRALNVLRFPWVRELLEELLKFRGKDFTASMPVLYSGNRPLAIAFVLRSGPVLHGWFAAFDRDAATFSPGLQLFMEILRTAPALGITRFDFGKGPEKYKQRFQNGVTRVGEGCVDPSATKAGARRAWQTFREGVRSTPLRTPLHRPAVALYQIRGWLELR